MIKTKIRTKNNSKSHLCKSFHVLKMYWRTEPLKKPDQTWVKNLLNVKYMLEKSAVYQLYLFQKNTARFSLIRINCNFY